MNNKTTRLPADLFERLNKNSLKYVVTGELSKGTPIADLIKRFTDSAIGTQIPGRSHDAHEAANVLREFAERLGE